MEPDLEMIFNLIWIGLAFFAWALGFSKGGQR